jgi:hypothetical protein
MLMYNLEVYITEFDQAGHELRSWTVETFDFQSVEAIAGALKNVGTMLASGGLQPDSFDGDYESDTDWYDDELYEIGAEHIDPYE